MTKCGIPGELLSLYNTVKNTQFSLLVLGPYQACDADPSATLLVQLVTTNSYQDTYQLIPTYLPTQLLMNRGLPI